MKGRLTKAQRAFLVGVKLYEKRYGAGPTLSYCKIELENGTPLEQMLPRLLADGWLKVEKISGCGARLVAAR